MLNTSKKLSLTTTLIILTNILYLQTSSCQEPYFKATFENGIDTEIGGYRIETKNGAEVKRIQNPFPDNMNSSSFVIKSVIYKNDQTKSSNGRAEYSGGRLITNEKRMIYKFDLFMPSDFRNNLRDSYTMILSQFKTNPCSDGGVAYGEEYDFDDEICWGMGIYNDLRIKPEHITYRLRAYPDCNELSLNTPVGQWVSYVIETYWTNSSKGYTNVYENGKLAYSQTNIKTLMDGFIENKCDIFWSIGLYTRIEKKESIYVLLDNLYVYDGDKYSVSDVCNICNEDKIECQQFNLTADKINESNGQNNGSIDISITDGSAPFTYQWSNGSTQEDLHNLSEGNYHLTVTDKEGCSETHQWTINNIEPNADPVIQANYQQFGKPGEIITIDASKSYDPNGDQLSYTWQIPEGIDVSSKTAESIEFIAPFVEDSLELEFILELTDTKETAIRETFKLTIQPLQCEEVEIQTVEASSSADPTIPENVLDNDTITRWSADGTSEYIILSATEPTKLNSIGLSFFNRLGERKAYFSIQASQDGSNWISLMPDLESCGFSNKMHVYNLPASVQDKTYSFVKINGKGNTENTWNSFTEIKLYKPSTETENNPPVIKILLSTEQ